MNGLSRLGLGAVLIGVCGAAAPADVSTARTIASAGSNIQAMGLMPGLWRSTFRVVKAEARPLSPTQKLAPGLAEKAAAMIGTVYAVEGCYDPAAAVNGDLILPQIKLGGDCQTQRFEIVDGRVDLALSCGGPSSGVETKVRLRGVHQPESLDLTTETDAAVLGRGERMLLTVSSTGARIGPCLALPVPPPPPP